MYSYEDDASLDDDMECANCGETLDVCYCDEGDDADFVNA